MKVKDLIHELEKHNKELIVRIRDHIDVPADECGDIESLTVEFDDERSFCDILILESENV